MERETYIIRILGYTLWVSGVAKGARHPSGVRGGRDGKNSLYTVEASRIYYIEEYFLAAFFAPGHAPSRCFVLSYHSNKDGGLGVT